jgi:hypothetical protein
LAGEWGRTDTRACVRGYVEASLPCLSLEQGCGTRLQPPRPSCLVEEASGANARANRLSARLSISSIYTMHGATLFLHGVALDERFLCEVVCVSVCYGWRVRRDCGISVWPLDRRALCVRRPCRGPTRNCTLFHVRACRRYVMCCGSPVPARRSHVPSPESGRRVADRRREHGRECM